MQTIYTYPRHGDTKLTVHLKKDGTLFADYWGTIKPYSWEELKAELDKGIRTYSKLKDLCQEYLDTYYYYLRVKNKYHKQLHNSENLSG